MNNLDSGSIAVIFDMDGVLVDNAVYHQRAFKEYFASMGGRDFTLDMFGKSNEDIMKLMFPGILDEKIKEYSEGKEAYYREIYKPNMKLLAGLIDFLKELKASGIKTAVGSSAPTVNVDFVVDTLDIRRYFDEFVDSSGVARAKPAPDIYLKAAKLLEVEPSKCLVFEDAIAGIEAARNAGMKVIGVATTLTYDKLDNTNGRIHDFTEINVDYIKNLFI
jgi:beta-phosphoglucomutase family hydrolase